MGPQHMRRPSRPQAEDAVLGMNPDFQIPGVGMGGMPGRGGMRGGGGFRGRGGSGMGIPRGGGPYGYPGAI